VKPRFFSHHDETLLIFLAHTFANPWRRRVIFLGKVLVYGLLALAFLYHLVAPVLRLFGVNAPDLPEWVFENMVSFTIGYFVLKIILAWSERKLVQRLSLPGSTIPEQILLTEQMRMLFPAALGLVQVGMYPPSYVAFREWEMEQPREERTAESGGEQEASPLLGTEATLPTEGKEKTSNPANKAPLERQEVQKRVYEVVSIRALLLEELTLILIDEIGRECPFTFPDGYTERYAALVAYLAKHGDCTRQELKMHLYSELSNKDNSFDMDRRERIMPIIQKVASAHNMIFTSSLFENAQDAEKGTVWRLRPYCRVDTKIQDQLERRCSRHKRTRGSSI
jgi:hypothetical protein